MGRNRQPFEDRFWGKVKRGDPDECWLWLGSTRGLPGHLYGVISYNGRREGAHRACWMFHNGPVPDGLEVMHSCDNKLCVNPAHLFLGTHQENMIDAARKKRKNTPSGERCNLSKLTEPIEIVRMLKVGDRVSKIARKFNVTTTAISYIKNGTNWKHIPR